VRIRHGDLGFVCLWCVMPPNHKLTGEPVIEQRL
jgi:hypothetical protein